MAKVRESGMPQQEVWEKFFDPLEILSLLEMTGATDVAEFGCGYGTFSIPLAKSIKGRVFSFDIEPEMVATTKETAHKEGIQNLEVQVRVFLAQGTGLGAETVDQAMLFNILHLENPVVLLTEAFRILKPSGRVCIIHWNHDPTTPRGPSLDIRPKPEQCIQWAREAGFEKIKELDLKPYHYGIILEKKRWKA